jgi:hypothetical protein
MIIVIIKYLNPLFTSWLNSLVVEYKMSLSKGEKERKKTKYKLKTMYIIEIVIILIPPRNQNSQ